MLSGGLVSVIIPAFNAEKTIKKCINSIENQNYSKLEIIIIDDGSTDLTVKVCKELACFDKRIKIISIANGGVSRARNIGIENSHGDWIVFVDADDWIKHDFIQNAIKKQKQYFCDTCCFNGAFVMENRVELMKPIQPKSKVYKEDEIKALMNSLYIPQQFINPGEYFRAVWGKLLSVTIIRKNGIRFSENIRIGEDALFLLDYFSKAKKVYIEDSAFYFYLTSNLSATRKYRENYELTIREEYEQMIERFANYNLDDKNASICFWRTASRNYLTNQLWRTNDPVQATNLFTEYLNNEDGSKYLKMFKQGDGFKTKVDVVLYRLGLYRLAGLVKALKIIKFKERLQK